MMTESNKRRNWPKYLIGATITVLCLVIIARQVNISEVIAALENFQWEYLAMGIASLAFGYSLRIFRWALMLSATGTKIKCSTCAAPFLGSIALNNILPLRLGDVVRAFVFPSAMGISKTVATTSLIMERLIDLMTLLGCLAIGLVILSGTHLPPLIAESAVTMAIVGGVTLILGFLFSGSLARYITKIALRRSSSNGPDRLYKLLVIVSDLLSSFEVMSRPKVLFYIIIISMFVWVGESGLFYFLLVGFNFNATPAVAVVVMSIATLSTLVPSSPGYVGPFHLAAFAAVSMLGGTAAQAGSYAILSHLALWLPTTLAGAIAILMKPELFRTIHSRSAS
ncbi:TIGR00374 family protein [Yersinia hibernica]|uniref:TIGR00374 family protein n=2 Tax=Yersinia TaxID=629 RepID=A0A7U4JZH2_YEREN|nr:TIGR00374 family protein [Yersinia hibernica]OVZ83531.1 TIGR00374 family protein [Yersinia kristensenii]